MSLSGDHFRIITFRLLLLDCHVQIVAFQLSLSDCHFPIVTFRLSLSDCHFPRRSFWELLLYEPVIVRVCFPDMLFPIRYFNHFAWTWDMTLSLTTAHVFLFIGAAVHFGTHLKGDLNSVWSLLTLLVCLYWPNLLALGWYVKSVFIVHVGGTRCVTSSTDNNLKIRARITLTVEFIRGYIFIFLFYV